MIIGVAGISLYDISEWRGRACCVDGIKKACKAMSPAGVNLGRNLGTKKLVI